MIKVIDGKRYNTDTAEMVYQWTNGYFPTDFNYRSKTLYRTERGAWFIHHKGGANTDMARQAGNSYSGGEDIEPITEDEAYEFLERHSGDEDAAEALEAYFADRLEDA